MTSIIHNKKSRGSQRKCTFAFASGVDLREVCKVRMRKSGTGSLADHSTIPPFHHSTVPLFHSTIPRSIESRHPSSTLILWAGPQIFNERRVYGLPCAVYVAMFHCTFCIILEWVICISMTTQARDFKFAGAAVQRS